jgi:hypothetical protein
MPIEFRCGQCGKLLRTGDDTVGRQAQCPECGALSTIPSSSETPGTPPPLAPLDAGRSFASEPRPAGTAVMENPFQTPSQFGPPATTNSKAVVALVLGLAGLGFWCCPLIGLPITIAGLVLGIMSLRSSSRGMAIAAIVLSSVGLALTIVNAILGAVIALAQ